MIISVVITQDIYKDKQNRWRNIHIILNCFALLLFMGQGMTGTRDLLSIPYSWQIGLFGNSYQIVDPSLWK